MTKQIVKKKTINKEIEKTQKKKLSIQFSLDGFSFYISNSHNIISKFTSFEFPKAIKSPVLILKEIQEIFKNEKSLQQDFEFVNVIHQNNLSSLVPNQYFKDNDLNNYLKYSIKTITTDLIVYDDLNFIKAKNVYVPFVNINNFFSTFILKTIARKRLILGSRPIIMSMTYLLDQFTGVCFLNGRFKKIYS